MRWTSWAARKTASCRSSSRSIPRATRPRCSRPISKSFGPAFVGLTGSDTAIAKAAHAYRVYYAKHPLPGGGYAMDHSERDLSDGPGREVHRLLRRQSLGPDALAEELKKPDLDVRHRQVRLQRRRDQRVAHQADNGHGADAARHRRDRARDLRRGARSRHRRRCCVLPSPAS